MFSFFSCQRMFFGGLTAMLLAGCAAPVDKPPVAAVKPTIPACQPAAADDQLVGNWLSVRTQKGVVGELRTLFTLKSDGAMAYTELLKRGKQPSQGLSESGCWQRTQQTLTIQTLESHGAPVNLEDPIYKNNYAITSVNAKALTLQGPDGKTIKARSMSPGYRLPF
ncbi:MAG: hypothetical protein KA735_14930 [Burkholderiaceae bacterium]|nr:hypothetical protein [Burkholderiaceae bacterium]